MRGVASTGRGPIEEGGEYHIDSILSVYVYTLKTCWMIVQLHKLYQSYVCFFFGEKQEFESHLRALMKEIRNVESNGNCGFRAVEVAVKGNQNSWREVRAEMRAHLLNKAHFFRDAWGDVIFQRISEGLNSFDIPAPFKHWFDSLDM